ncbi:hypothetical protein Q5752_004598 [Cryptotrichosporon argae]
MAAPKRPASVEYAIFDMDGLLLYVNANPCDTETVMTRVIDGILSRYGYRMTWDIKQGTMGRSQRLATEYIYSQCPTLADQFPIDDYLVELNETYTREFKAVQPMRGALELVERLHRAGVPIALATGSGNRMYAAKTSHLSQLFGLFPPDCIITADSPEVPVGRTKPWPDVFLAAARKLGRDVGTPDACTEAQHAERAKGIVFEDAPLGVQAGVAAGMKVVWIPHPELRAINPAETHGATEVLSSLDEWRPEVYGLQL